MSRKIQFTGPEPYIILASVAAVWLVEHFGRKYLGPRVAAQLGVPLPSTTHRLATAPDTLPDNWFTGFVPLGNETWLMQDDATHWCFGVLKAERDIGELVLTMQRRVPFAWIASVAGIFAIAGYVVEEDREMMYLTGAAYSVIWGLQILRSYLWLGKVLREVAGRVKFFAESRS
jgi:hypothetical protein